MLKKDDPNYLNWRLNFPSIECLINSMSWEIDLSLFSKFGQQSLKLFFRYLIWNPLVEWTVEKTVSSLLSYQKPPFRLCALNNAKCYR